MEHANINIISVIGAGLMGHGIAQIFAMHGFNVNLIDISNDILKMAIKRIRASLEKFISKGKISSEDMNDTLNRIKTFVELSRGVENSDFIIEAVPEDINLKIKIFKEADSVAPRHAPIVSNTSSLPITALAESTYRREKVAGMHWFNPPQIMKLIEVIRCKYTSDETMNLICKLAQSLGKHPIVVNRDIRSFIANRVYRAIRYEALAMVQRGEYKPVEIDSAMRYRLKLPMGVFELIDFTGAAEIEVLEGRVIKDLCKKFPDWEPDTKYLKFREYALKLLIRYYENGFIGVKAGKGFYEYQKPGQWTRIDIPIAAGENVDLISLISPAINLASWLIENKITTIEEVDLSLKLGYRFPKGIFELADEWGIDHIIQVLGEKLEKWRHEKYSVFYEPQPILKDMAKNGMKFYDISQRTGGI